MLCRFAAENEVGPGDWSEELQQLMPKVDVPQPPTLVCEWELGDGTGRERWTHGVRGMGMRMD